MNDKNDTHSSGTVIPVPPDFPVKWDDEIESTLLWTWDDFHAPLPRTPMTSSVSQFTRAGMTQASKDTGTYRPGGKSKTINGYPYSASSAPPMTEQEEADRASSLKSRIATVRANWDEVWLPEIQRDLDEMKSIACSELESGALWHAVCRVLELHRRHWHIHHLVVMPVIEQSNRLESICTEILGAKEESVVPVLLRGTENMTVRSVNELESLAVSARGTPEVSGVLSGRTDQTDPVAVREALGRTATGREWLADLDVYLKEFGYRCSGFDLSFPTWIEDQSFVFQIIRGLLVAQSTNVHTAADRERALREEKEALVRRIREAAAGESALLERFEEAYRLGQQTWPLKEDHSHYIDQASTALVRINLVKIGHELEDAGVVGTSEDIWYLELDEAENALTGRVPSGIRENIATRRAKRERFSKLTPPKYLGTFPPDHDAAKDAENVTESSGTLRGTAASKGEASGIARVVMSPDDFHKVNPGDVLVCRSTAPMWTPLFSVISALVSEAGGILSHPAVVAREFELPAVVGVSRATSLIVDGQPVRVSGTDGLVHTG